MEPDFVEDHHAYNRFIDCKEWGNAADIIADYIRISNDGAENPKWLRTVLINIIGSINQKSESPEEFKKMVQHFVKEFDSGRLSDFAFRFN